MKKIFFITLALFVTGLTQHLQAQQDPQYSQYMFNGLLLNPAYAGSRELWSATALGRYQWTGIEGAPRTATLSLNGISANERSGFGFSLTEDRLGITSQTITNLMYAYRMSLGPGTLSLGIQGGINLFQNRWSDAVTVDPDQGVPMVNSTALLPLAGTGAYYYGERFYLGFSVPNLIENKYKNPNSVGGDVASRQRRHYFSTAGVVIPIGSSLDFKPSVLMKLTESAPVEFDFNAAILYKNMFWVGASYRTGDALVFMAEYVHNNTFRIGYAYDRTLTELSTVNNGSHELMLGIDFGFAKSRIKTPRYF